MAFADLISRLDPDPRVRGRQFERICAWYLRNAPEYRRRFRKVWLWSDWPDAWAADAGIDLVAEEHGGDLWAIQAKAYAPEYAIKKADVDSFLSESSRPGITYRLLIATTDNLGPTAKRTLDDQREPAGYRLRSELELAPVAWPSSPDDLRPRRPARKKPFPHVREAINGTVRGFKRTDRGQLLMACGTGKTLAAMWISERLDARRTLILLPSLSLLAQTLREWSANASKPFDYLAVCSDESVAGQDDFVEHTAELGLPVTTDPDVIAAFLRGQSRRVVFATYQSSPQVAGAFKDRTPQFDLAVADEAHRCAGRVGTEFTTILDPEQIKTRRRLFMTATPRFYTPRVRREAGELDVEVASMDDDPKGPFGPVLHRLTFGEAIERNLLSDYQVVVVGVTDSMYRDWAEQGEFVTLDGNRVTDARGLAGQIGLAKTMRKYDLKRIVSFHSRVAAARRFADELPAVIAWLPRSSRPSGRLWADHVSGAMSSSVRDARLRHLRAVGEGERGLLTNARCLGEGVDVPMLDGVAFIDPRRSTIDIIQALGRAIRKAPDKKVGTIVIPVFVDEDADPEDALDSSGFKHVWDVLKALRAHDEQLAEKFDELRRGLGARRAPPERPGKIKLDVPSAKVGAEFARAFNALLPFRPLFVPDPARERFQPSHTLFTQGPSGSPVSLSGRPVPKLVSVVVPEIGRNPAVPTAVYKPAKVRVTVLPIRFERIPHPAPHRLEPPYALLGESSVAEPGPLDCDPLAKSVPIAISIAAPNPAMTLTRGESHQPGKGLLPGRFILIPRPSFQRTKTLRTILREFASPVELPLICDPVSEEITNLSMTGWHKAVPLALHKLL